MVPKPNSRQTMTNMIAGRAKRVEPSQSTVSASSRRTLKNVLNMPLP